MQGSSSLKLWGKLSRWVSFTEAQEKFGRLGACFYPEGLLLSHWIKK